MKIYIVKWTFAGEDWTYVVKAVNIKDAKDKLVKYYRESMSIELDRDALLILECRNDITEVF